MLLTLQSVANSKSNLLSLKEIQKLEEVDTFIFICRMLRVMPGAASGGDRGSGTGP